MRSVLVLPFVLAGGLMACMFCSQAAAQTPLVQQEAEPAGSEEQEPPPAGWGLSPPAARQGEPALSARLSVSLTAAAAEQTQVSGAARSTETSNIDATLGKTVGLKIRAESARLAAQGNRLIERRQYLQAAYALASAYALSPNSTLLYSIAQVYRRADLDYEALAVYQRLLAEFPAFPQRMDAEEDLRGLMARLEDPEIGITGAIRQHLDTAKRNFQSGQFGATAEEYALVLAVKRLPRLLFNIAQAHRRAGRLEEALLYYSRFLDEDPGSPLRKEVVGYLSELRTVALRPPVYRRPWFWSVLGLTAAALAAGSAGLVVGVQQREPVTTFGTSTQMYGLQR